MAVGGTVSTPIFKQDGQYLTFKVQTATPITLGQVVMLAATGDPATVSPATTTTAKVIGVAVSGNRVSRTASDNIVAAGDLVTVCTRGVVNCTVGTNGATVGKELKVDTDTGTVTDINSASYVNTRLLVGRALATGISTEVIPVLLAIR